MINPAEKKVVGVGSPIVDLLAHVDEAFLNTCAGTKGGMELVDDSFLCGLLEKLVERPALAAGGSAANTVFALARLGLPAAFIGKLGRDAMGRHYLDEFERLRGDRSRFKYCDGSATARCLSLITPDGERTMRTCLGAAAHMAAADIAAADFEGFDHAHIEGFLLFNPDLTRAALQAARAAGCTVSLDLGSFEVVRAAGPALRDLLKESVDMVFANEEEAEAFCGTSDPEHALDELAALCSTAVVKLGAAGSLIQDASGRIAVEALRVSPVVDTTGAGDFWAAGFLYGKLNGLPSAECGRLGSLLGAAVVQHLGADLPPECWRAVHEQFIAVASPQTP